MVFGTSRQKKWGEACKSETHESVKETHDLTRLRSVDWLRSVKINLSVFGNGSKLLGGNIT